MKNLLVGKDVYKRQNEDIPRNFRAEVTSYFTDKQFLNCDICMLLGMLAHGFMFANKIPNHDDLAQYEDLTGTGVQLSLIHI